MRTTLVIDDDVLALAKSLADTRRSTAGKIISELARKGLRPQSRLPASAKRNGFVLMPPRKKGRQVTMELVNRLRDETE